MWEHAGSYSWVLSAFFLFTLPNRQVLIRDKRELVPD